MIWPPRTGQMLLPSPGQGSEVPGDLGVPSERQMHDTRHKKLIGKLRHEGALEEGEIKEGFLGEVFDLTLKEEKKRSGAIGCTDAHSGCP